MPTVLLRPILPKRQKILDMDRVQEELEDALDNLKYDLIQDFDSTVATWDTHVDFAGRKYIAPNETRLIVYPVGDGADVWGYVNYGTRPHPIVAHGSSLRFQSGYRAKTRPGRIAASGGGAFGSTVFARAVMHPGTEARNFTKAIGDKRKADFRRMCENALRRAVR